MEVMWKVRGISCDLMWIIVILDDYRIMPYSILYTPTMAMILGAKMRFPNAFTCSNKSKSSNYRKLEPMAKVIYMYLHT